MHGSKYIAEFLAEQEVIHPFVYTGGAVFNLIDSIAENPSLNYICPAHEQAGAMAADAYSRVSGNIGVAVTTSGPGATNLLTGVCCSYYDSIPTMFLTGQVSSGKLKRDMGVRQFGFQETDVPKIFEHITKYSKLVDNPEKLRFELEKANYLARNGRPGPVLLDIPNDVQRANIDPYKLEGYVPETVERDKDTLERMVDETAKLLGDAERPVIILGGGVRLSGAEAYARDFIEKLGVPVALTWATKDMLPYDHPLVIEGFGVSSNRAGNFAVQNADFILALGTRLDTHETSKLSTFAREAKKVVVDIDNFELGKYAPNGMIVDVLANYDVGDFLKTLDNRGKKTRELSDWIGRIDSWKENYPICLPEYFDQKDNVNPYVFMDVLSKESQEGDIVITDAGGNLTWTMQGFRVKNNQRLFSAFNHSPMGYSLPASMGASLASDGPVTCIIGDGGIQINIQELGTIKHYNLPIKTFLFNNKGYGIIHQTLDNYMDGRYNAVSSDTGVALPNLGNIAKAYGFPIVSIKNHDELEKGIRQTLDFEGPVLCDVQIDQHQKIEPKLISGRPLEEYSPALSPEEFSENMIVRPLDK
tara:strand:- start:30982 stop:32745 length:1764 start_codon:yes stop_codon:yes gene_type:complete